MDTRPLLSQRIARGTGSLLLSLAAAALAQEQPRLGPSGTLADRAARSEALTPTLSITQANADPLATAGAPAIGTALPERYPVAQQTMVWAQRRAWALGVGLEQRQRYEQILNGRGAEGLPIQNAGMLLGLSLATSDNSRLVMQAPLTNPGATSRMHGPGGNGADEALLNEQRQIRMGLVFQKNDQMADLRRGMLMKVELSGQTTLSIKPRAGRIGVTLTSRF